MKHWVWRAYFGVFLLIVGGATLGLGILWLATDTEVDLSSSEIFYAAITWVGIVGLYGYCYGKRIGNRYVWLGVLYLELLNVGYSFVSDPPISFTDLAASAAVLAILFGPYLYALFDYSKWVKARVPT
ncbi:MAG: hypothetical protein AAF358_21805 [Pseudomonadota bacterium]